MPGTYKDPCNFLNTSELTRKVLSRKHLYAISSSSVSDAILPRPKELFEVVRVRGERA